MGIDFILAAEANRRLASPAAEDENAAIVEPDVDSRKLDSNS